MTLGISTQVLETSSTPNEDKDMSSEIKVQRPEWAHEYMRHVGNGQWVCDGCPLESCDCDSEN